MKKNTREVIILLDQSESMKGNKEIAISRYHEFLHDWKDQKEEVFVTLILFNDRYTYHHIGVPPEEAEIRKEDYIPKGNTALNDTIGRTCKDIGRRFSMTPKYLRPEHIVIAIITDNEDNASHIFRQENVRQEIHNKIQKYGWEFIQINITNEQDGILTEWTKW